MAQKNQVKTEGRSTPQAQEIQSMITSTGLGLDELARSAGLSGATLYRAIKGWQPVREATMEALRYAAQKVTGIGSVPDGPKGRTSFDSDLEAKLTLIASRADADDMAIFRGLIGVVYDRIADERRSERHRNNGHSASKDLAESSSQSPVYVTPDNVIHMPRGIELKPALGAIAAGLPQEAIEEAEQWVAVPKALSKQVSYVLKVHGDSMVEENIHHGDFVLVNVNATPHTGDVVVAVVDGETTLKKYVAPKGKKRASLASANKSFPPQIVPVDELIIKGVMVGKL